MKPLRYIAYTAILAWLAWVLFRYWQAGALSTWSFWILGAVGVFEVSCVCYLMRGFHQYRTDPKVIDLEARRAANRAPRKRFGNAPRVMP